MLALDPEHVFALDAFGALVLVEPLAREDLDIHHDPLHPRGNGQRGVLHIARLLPEDGAQQLFLWRELGLSFGRHLAHEDVPLPDFRADADDAALVKVAQGVFADVGNVSGDLFLAQLGLAGLDLELFDVDRGKDIVADEALADQDRVLEVVPAPRHEGHEHVPAQCEVATVDRRPVSQHLAALDGLPHRHHRLLRDAGALVGPLELDQVVGVETNLLLFTPRLFLAQFRLDDDPGGIHALHDARALGQDDVTRVTGHDRLHASSHQRRLGLDEGDGLPLHVGAHQGAVRVIVLEERDQGSRHANRLLGGHVHVLHLIGVHQNEIPAVARGHIVGDQPLIRTDFGIGLSDVIPIPVDGREVLDLVRHLSLPDFPVRGLDKAELVHPGVGGQGGDQADVGSFRRLDRADPAVVGGMDIADLKARALAGQPAGPQGREAPFVGDLGQRVRLVHEL